jgi:hypothetical protein
MLTQATFGTVAADHINRLSPETSQQVRWHELSVEDQHHEVSAPLEIRELPTAYLRAEAFLCKLEHVEQAAPEAWERKIP